MRYREKVEGDILPKVNVSVTSRSLWSKSTMKKAACLGTRHFNPIWVKFQWLNHVPGHGNMSVYKDTNLVWCYMVQMMCQLGCLVVRARLTKPHWIGPEWLLKKPVDLTGNATKIKRKKRSSKCHQLSSKCDGQLGDYSSNWSLVFMHTLHSDSFTSG